MAAVASTVLVVMFSAMGWLLAMRRAVDSQGWQQQAYSNALTGKVELQQEIKRAVQDKRAVYVQYADPDQRSAVDALRPHLRGAGWLAPRSERVQSSPGTAQSRYFRDTDAEQARGLSGLFKRWGWGVVRPEFVKSNEGTWPISQFEVWLARPNPAELARLLKAIDSPVKDERTKALQALVDTQGASPAAIGAALAMASASSIEFVSAPGRFNLLYFFEPHRALGVGRDPNQQRLRNFGPRAQPQRGGPRHAGRICAAGTAAGGGRGG